MPGYFYYNCSLFGMTWMVCVMLSAARSFQKGMSTFCLYCVTAALVKILSNQSTLNFLFSIWLEPPVLNLIRAFIVISTTHGRCCHYILEKWGSFPLGGGPLHVVASLPYWLGFLTCSFCPLLFCSSRDPSARHWAVCSWPHLLVSKCKGSLFVRRCNPLSTECVE